jgi:hypothetical protein
MSTTEKAVLGLDVLMAGLTLVAIVAPRRSTC